MQPTGTYRATANHPSLGGQTVSGRLSLRSGRLAFEAEAVSLELPLAGLQVHSGGFNNEQVFLGHSAQPGWSISTSDDAVLRELAVADSALAAQIKAAGKQKLPASRLWVVGLGFVALVVGLIVLLFASKSALAGMAANKLPVSWEQQFGDAAFKSMQAEMKIVDDPQWQRYVDAVTNRLLPAVTNSPYTFQFHVVEAPDMNAFAIPGGHVVVQTGLLKAVERPEELAGVLAHELAHVTQRHSLRNMLEAAGLSLVVQALFGDASGLLAVASGGTELLLRQKFSRDTEREADDVGWDYLLAADIDPRGMIDFFEKLKKEIASNSSAAAVDGQLNFLSTHPATPERIARLEAKWKALPRRSEFRPISTNAVAGAVQQP